MSERVVWGVVLSSAVYNSTVRRRNLAPCAAAVAAARDG